MPLRCYRAFCFGKPNPRSVTVPTPSLFATLEMPNQWVSPSTHSKDYCEVDRRRLAQLFSSVFLVAPAALWLDLVPDTDFKEHPARLFPPEHCCPGPLAREQPLRRCSLVVARHSADPNDSGNPMRKSIRPHVGLHEGNQRISAVTLFARLPALSWSDESPQSSVSLPRRTSMQLKRLHSLSPNCTPDRGSDMPHP